MCYRMVMVYKERRVVSCVASLSCLVLEDELSRNCCGQGLVSGSLLVDGWVGFGGLSGDLIRILIFAFSTVTGVARGVVLVRYFGSLDIRRIPWNLSRSM